MGGGLPRVTREEGGTTFVLYLHAELERADQWEAIRPFSLQIYTESELAKLPQWSSKVIRFFTINKLPVFVAHLHAEDKHVDP
jgi:hypothetical protein